MKSSIVFKSVPSTTETSMGILLLPVSAAMDEAAAALATPVERYSGIHAATARLRGGDVDCAVVDTDRLETDVAGVVRRFQAASDAAVVLAVPPHDASVATEVATAAVVDRSDPEAMARRLQQIRTEHRLDRAEGRSTAARELLRSATGSVRESSEDVLETLAGTVVDELGETGPYPVAWVGQHDPERGTVRPVAAAGIPESHLRAVPVVEDGPDGGSAIARAVRADGAVVVEGNSTAGDATDVLAIRIPTEPAAVLSLVAGRPGGVPEPERSALERLGAAVSTAVGGTADPSDGRDDRVRLLADALAHELSNQLGAAGLQLDLAEEHGDPEHFEHVARALDRLEGMAAETRALAREEPELEWTELESATRNAWAAVSPTDASLEVEAATLEADPALLRLALVNLLRNAVEHGRHTNDDGRGGDGRDSDESDGDGRDSGTTDGLRVKVGPVGDEGFYVADNGPGIPQAERERVLEWGHSGSGGTGIGLGLVRLAAERHGWTVRITESEWGGARVVLGPPE